MERLSLERGRFDLPEPFHAEREELRRLVDAKEPPAEQPRGDARRTGAGERIEDPLPFASRSEKDAREISG